MAQSTQLSHTEHGQFLKVNLPNHWAGLVCKRLTSIVHILSSETDNCLSLISRRERMTVEDISLKCGRKDLTLLVLVFTL